MTSTKSFQTQAAQSPDPIEWDVDGESFYAAPALPAEGLMLMAVIADAGDEAPAGESARAVLDFLDLVLLPESAERYAARLKDPLKPIRLEEASEHAKWLIAEKYQSRPTEPPSS